MVQFGIFKLEKKNTFIVIGAITGLFGLYNQHLLIGTIVLICGIASKFMKSPYWSWLIFASFIIYTIYIVKNLWPF